MLGKSHIIFSQSSLYHARLILGQEGLRRGRSQAEEGPRERVGGGNGHQGQSKGGSIVPSMLWSRLLTHASFLQYIQWSGAEGHDVFFTDPGAKQLFKDHMDAMVNRRNTINNRLYKDDPTIFAWDLMNEPRCDCFPDFIPVPDSYVSCRPECAQKVQVSSVGLAHCPQSLEKTGALIRLFTVIATVQTACRHGLMRCLNT